jgi:hypothetical protein
MGMLPFFLFRLGCHPKRAGNEPRLACTLPFAHPLHLPFPEHVHGLVPLQGSPGGVKGEKAHPGFDQPFDPPMILFHQVVQILDLPKSLWGGKMSSAFNSLSALG